MAEYAMEPRRRNAASVASSRCWWCIALAVTCLTAALRLAVDYPVAPATAAAVIFVIAGVSWKWPEFWIFALPALLPVAGFAPWTGWITFEEVDMLILAMAAGGYARAGQMRLLLPSRIEVHTRKPRWGQHVAMRWHRY